MVLRILFLFLSIFLFVNLCILTSSYIIGENLYKKYGKQMLIIFCAFVFLVVVLYVALAFVALK